MYINRINIIPSGHDALGNTIIIDLRKERWEKLSNALYKTMLTEK